METFFLNNQLYSIDFNNRYADMCKYTIANNTICKPMVDFLWFMTKWIIQMPNVKVQ